MHVHSARRLGPLQVKIHFPKTFSYCMQVRPLQVKTHFTKTFIYCMQIDSYGGSPASNTLD